MGTVCSTQVIPIIKVDKGDTKTDSSQQDRKRVKVPEMDTSAGGKDEKQPWIPPDPTPMPKGIILTPEPSRLTVEENGARLSVGTHTPGSDALSPSGSSLRSSTDCSVASSSSRSMQIQDRGKAPPRLLSLSTDLHQLLMGRLEDTSRIQSRPRVIHLRLLAPSDGCTWERRALWQHTFVPLRKMCAERGYTLDIQDDLWYPQGPHVQCPTLSHATEEGGVVGDADAVDVMVVMLLTEVLAHNLPDHLSNKEFKSIVDTIQASEEPTLLPLLNTLYRDCTEGRDPSEHWLQRQEVGGGGLDKQRLSRLVSKMLQSVKARGVDTSAFLPPFYTKLKALMSNPSLHRKRTVVVSRTLSHVVNFDASSGYDFDPSASEDKGELTRIKTAVEKGCDPARRIKLDLARGDNKLHRDKDLNTSYLKEMGASVCGLMGGVLEAVMEERGPGEHRTVTGVSQSLIDELVTQAKRSRSLTQAQPIFFSGTLRSLQEYVVSFTEMPIVVYAPPGWGLSTLGAQLMEFYRKEMPNALVMYRSLGVSPDTMTIQSTLLSLHQQLDTILGSSGQTEEDSDAFPTKRLLTDIVSRSTAHLPITIFLEGVTLATSKLKELEVMTLNDSLPPTTKLIVMTSDAAVTRGLRLKMKDAFYVKAVPWEKQAIADLFSKTISDRKLIMSDSQTSVIANAIKQCPLPLFAVTAAQTVYMLSQTNQLSSGLQDFPTTIESVIKKLFDVAKNYFPPNCFPWLMGYFSGSVGGATSWEINDLLSTNDSVLQSIFPCKIENLFLHRAPSSLWTTFLRVLNPFLRVFISTHYSTTCWSSSTINRHAIETFIRDPGISETLHRDMCDYFQGKWAGAKKTFPISDDSKDNKEFSGKRFVTPQPTKYGSKLNVRKLQCLPYHSMLSDSKSSIPVEKFILNLPWVVYKLNAVSCLQFLLDLELAKVMDYSHSHPNDLDSIQAVVFKSINSLIMCGKEINKILHQSVILSKYKSKKELYKDSVYYSSTGYYKMIQSIDNIPFAYLIPLDKESTSLPQLSPIPTPTINDIVPIHSRSIFVAVVLKQEGEIRVIDTKTNAVVRTLKGLDKPTTLKMLDTVSAVVLCNRELYVINLDKGTIVSKLRTVLNIRKPLFGLQNKESVVVLSRDRMVVNVIDLKSGGIVSSFKAGETRFLESLLLSRDGKMLVCGDETQKPYPLLAWSLEQGKLLHDIRMSQHEFLTDMADISDDGRYLACGCKVTRRTPYPLLAWSLEQGKLLHDIRMSQHEFLMDMADISDDGRYLMACGCKEVSATDSNFIVVYDLVTGQLLKKFKMAGVVTSLVLSSKCLSVIAAMDSARLIVWDVVSGNSGLMLEGVHASVDHIQLSMDGRRCLTSCTREYSISAHTLSLWDIDKGHLLGSHTFHAQITCVRLSWDGQTVLAGVRGHSEPIRLALVSPRDEENNASIIGGGEGGGGGGGGGQDGSGSGSGKGGKGSSKRSRNDGNALDEQFGDSSRLGNVIQVSSPS